MTRLLYHSLHLCSAQGIPVVSHLIQKNSQVFKIDQQHIFLVSFSLISSTTSPSGGHSGLVTFLVTFAWWLLWNLPVVILLLFLCAVLSLHGTVL